MDRRPPIGVRRLLRREVGFGCPVPDCGNPYLHYHHFDPPWNVMQHHNPEGMIALCGEHHPMADVGTFTPEQLREFKRRGRREAPEIRGKFQWMRREVLGVAGNFFGFETPTIVQINQERVVWLNRDDEGYVLLNVRMPTLSEDPRAEIADNEWLSRGEPEDVDCPPSGRVLDLRYSNGDRLRVEFLDLPNLEAARRKYPDAEIESWRLPYPIIAAEVHLAIGGTGISFGPTQTKWRDAIFQGNFAHRSGVVFRSDY